MKEEQRIKGVEEIRGEKEEEGRGQGREEQEEQERQRRERKEEEGETDGDRIYHAQQQLHQTLEVVFQFLAVIFELPGEPCLERDAFSTLMN